MRAMRQDRFNNSRFTFGVVLMLFGAVFMALTNGSVAGPITLGLVGLVLVATSFRGPGLV